jgi:putative PIN family toxin of toxin-antitoxin system
MGERSVVYDTNTIISALGFDGSPQIALFIGFTRGWDMYFSEEILTEVERVMGYDKLPITEETADLFLAIMRDEGIRVEPDVSVDASDDPDDNNFLECALEADARYLVSGDRDLLDLDEFRGVDIVDASGFLDRQAEGI